MFKWAFNTFLDCMDQIKLIFFTKGCYKLDHPMTENNQSKIKRYFS